MNLSIRYSLIAPESLLSLYILTVVIPTLLDLTRFFEVANLFLLSI